MRLTRLDLNVNFKSRLGKNELGLAGIRLDSGVDSGLKEQKSTRFDEVSRSIPRRAKIKYHHSSENLISYFKIFLKTDKKLIGFRSWVCNLKRKSTTN